METAATFTFRVPAIDRITEQVRDYYLAEHNIDYPVDVIRKAFTTWFERRTSLILENVAEILMMPHLPEAKAFARVLEETAMDRAIEEAVFAAELERASHANKYTGFRPFSAARLAAVVQYLAYRCKDLYATKLNKLLFYADFSYFSVMRLGLTGAHYVKLTHGPILDGYDAQLAGLEASGKIRIREFPAKGRIGKQVLPPKDYRPEKSELDEEQRKLLDWVIETYGKLTTPEIVAASHQESAYWETNYQQPIDYNYAASLRKQPPKELVR